MRSAQLSIVLPTYKERGNVAELVRRLDIALAGISWEAIFVDDNSPDGTAIGTPRQRNWTSIRSSAAPNEDHRRSKRST